MKLVMTHRKTGDKHRVIFDYEDVAQDINDPDHCLWLGSTVIMDFPKEWATNSIVDFKWIDAKHGESEGLFYTQAWLYGKAINGFRANNRCECGKVILCECHDKCLACSKCKTAEIAVWGMGKLGKLLLAKLPRDRYDDHVENQIRDAMESGDYRRSDYYDEEEDE